ncbi:MAG TPA: DUF4232 domain-containing protein [Jatrophihabitans sp.]|jgi:hypothetical protein|nr:DUF4232 domain-containing protein [Jatrophihabitans sp.]
MTPDELDAAIREELRLQARRAPAAAPVRTRVLHATEALRLEDLPPQGLRAWVLPILAAAAVLLVALGLTAGSQLLRSDGPRTPPAVGSTSAPVSPTPTTSAPSSPAPPTAATVHPSPSASSAPAGAHSSAAASSPATSRPGSSVPQDWYLGLDADALPHTPGLCPDKLTVGHVRGMGAPTISVPGEPAPLWLVPVTCLGPTDASHPAPVEVFRYRPTGPELVQTLAYQPGDQHSITVTAIDVGSGSVTLAEHGYNAPRDALCCRSLRFTQTFSWQSGAHFVAGPQLDAVPPCIGDQLTVTSTPLDSESGDARGLLLRYTNNGEQPCALTGYPGAAIVDATGQPLADAARTAAGFFGGLASGEAPRVVLFSSVTGSAVIEWTAAQYGDSPCYTDATLLSTPPGTTATTSYGAQSQVCGPQVHPVVYGDTGKQ